MQIAEPKGAPVALILVGLFVGLLLLAGTGFFAWRLLSDPGDERSNEGTSMSFGSAISLLMGRSDAILASAPEGEPPIESLPVLITADALRIRSHKVLDLDDGRFERKDTKGLVVTPLLPILMAERAAIAPTPTAGEAGEASAPPQESKALGRGSDVLLVLGETSIPFKTIARLIYTAQSAGYRKLLLGGVAESSARKVVALAVSDVNWWPIGPGLPGRGIGVVADATDGYVLFHRGGKDIADEGNRISVSSLSTDKLSDRLTAIKDRQRGTKLLTLQPDGRVQYETLLAMVAVVRTEGLFEKVILGGGGVD